MAQPATPTTSGSSASGRSPVDLWRRGSRPYRPTKPVILAAEGFARAGGTEILQGTDIRVAGESAVFGVTEVQRGLFPMAGSTVRLRRQIGYAVAAEMLLSGEDLPAQRAYELGLINHVVPDGQALAKAREIAATHREQRTARREGASSRRCARPRRCPRPRPSRSSSSTAVTVMASEDAREGPPRVPREARPRVQGPLAELAEAAAELVDEQVGLLERGEVPAPVDLLEPAQVAVGLLGPAS